MNGRRESDTSSEAPMVAEDTDSECRSDLLEKFANTAHDELESSKGAPVASEASTPEQTEETTGTPVDDHKVPALTAEVEAVSALELNETEYRVSPDRRRHILDGDATGGGHRAGTGRVGKSEFPPNWSDDKIIEAIESVANDSSSACTPGRNGATVFRGSRDSIDINVIVDKNKIILTGYPIGVPRNQ